MRIFQVYLRVFVYNLIFINVQSARVRALLIEVEMLNFAVIQHVHIVTKRAYQVSHVCPYVRMYQRGSHLIDFCEI
jgi:metal-dependent HD superfamily phosphatase/phosphodiesterase